MLLSLHIRDFALIDQLEVELHAGMTALTGETGAGKSILLDALLLAMGGRADSGSVRAGSARAEISAEFAISGKHRTNGERTYEPGDHDEPESATA